MKLQRKRPAQSDEKGGVSGVGRRRKGWEANFGRGHEFTTQLELRVKFAMNPSHPMNPIDILSIHTRDENVHL